MPSWDQLVDLLQAHVPAGCVTTYGSISDHLYPGQAMLNQPVSAMLRGAVNHGHADLTRRVVQVDGTFAAERPDGGPTAQYLALVAEGVPFVQPGQIDLDQCPPVRFA